MAKHKLEIFLAFFVVGAASVLGGPRLVMLTNHTRGDFIVAQDVWLQTSLSYGNGTVYWTGSALWSGIVSSICACRNMCWAMATCLTFSYNAVSSQCVVTDKGPHEYYFTSGTGSLIVYFTRAFGTYSSTKGPDGFLYAISSFTNDFNASKDACSRIPGHRLGVIRKMNQMDFFINLWTQSGSSGTWVDLIGTTGGMRWGDGTYMDNTELKGKVEIVEVMDLPYAFRYTSGRLDDMSLGNSYRFLCQADPSGNGW
ncbi:uncharacterized protein LOC135204933 [Macrobrachium nipponense]|uniref:uncharacterized protein LOC135204933 n=1 Tax=Macrobrachium nipponense TaxID=159736 RepID=UPI0030C8BE42